MLFDFGLGTNYGFRNHKWSKGVVSMIANGITIDYHVFSTQLDNSWSSISGKVASRKRFSIFYTTGSISNFYTRFDWNKNSIKYERSFIYHNYKRNQHLSTLKHKYKFYEALSIRCKIC